MIGVLGRAESLVVIVAVHFNEVITLITVMVVTAMLANFEVRIATRFEKFVDVSKPICKLLAITELTIVIAIAVGSTMVNEPTVVAGVDPTIYSLASFVANVIIVGWSIIEKSTTVARTAIITIEAVIAASSTSTAITCLIVMVIEPTFVVHFAFKA